LQIIHHPCANPKTLYQPAPGLGGPPDAVHSLYKKSSIWKTSRYKIGHNPDDTHLKIKPAA